MSWGCQKVMVEILEVVKNPKNSAIFAKKCLKMAKSYISRTADRTKLGDTSF